MNKLIHTAVASLVLATGTAFAGGTGHGHQNSGHGSAYTPAQVAQAGAEMTDGEVRKVDKENKKITIKHGEIKNLGMPGMTMVFQVKERAMLDKVQQGDKVRFAAEKSDSGLVVTSVETAK